MATRSPQTETTAPLRTKATAELPSYRARKAVFAAAFGLSVSLSAAVANAQTSPPAAAAPAVPAGAEVRLSVSKAAADFLSEPRVRRLLDIELEESASLSPAAEGTLDNHVVLVWIDLTTPSRALLQVRVVERPLSQREISLTNLAPDVAARLVAIATAQMIRAQLRPLRPKRAPAPRVPTPQEVELAERGERALVVEGAASFAALPSGGALLGGPSLALGLRQAGLTQRVEARWLGGTSEGGKTRWGEVGLGADYRVWLDPSIRLSFGALAAMGTVSLGDARSVEGVVGDLSTWSARAAARVGAELRIAKPVWLGLSLEPGVLLRSVHYEDDAGAARTLDGAFLGVDLTLVVDHR